MSASLTISCDDCTMQGSAACDDCMVTFICNREAGALVIDLAAERTLRLLAGAGLVPELRHTVLT